MYIFKTYQKICIVYGRTYKSANMNMETLHTNSRISEEWASTYFSDILFFSVYFF